MEELDKDIELLLTGQALFAEPIDVPIHTDFRPITKKTVGYIVCAVIFNDEEEVLMIQEAKSSCRGRWYLPAGRMERGETIVEAVKREVLEEAGLEFEPTTLVSVEVASGYWYRFTVTGTITGGTLKTKEDTASESLQAKWASLDLIGQESPEFVLRAKDVLPLIKTVQDYRAAEVKYESRLPTLNMHKHLVLRLLLVHHDPENSSSDLQIAVGTEPVPHIPCGMISEDDQSLNISISRILMHIFNKLPSPPNILGVLSLEHDGKPPKKRDGICLALLISLGTTRELPTIIDEDKYLWYKVTDNTSLKDAISTRLKPGKTIPLMLLR